VNGADSLLAAMTRNGIDVCFANPGTSELHFVAALDRAGGMRCVLGLFEGVLTGAADGYARMADRPASTLLHLGPGLANGLSNLHNAMRAQSPIVNIIGDHATHHRHYDAPLTSDIEGTARPFSHWVRTSPHAESLAADAAAAVAAARTAPGRVASLILPADASWALLTAEPSPARAVVPPPPQVPDTAIDAAIACPGRKVVVLESDGSGMYMPQALWTQAREQLDILTLVFANRTYQILRHEMRNVGVAPGGPKAEALTDIGDRLGGARAGRPPPGGLAGAALPRRAVAGEHAAVRPGHPARLPVAGPARRRAQKARCGSGSPAPGTGSAGPVGGRPRRACPATSRANPRTPTRPTMVRGDMNSRTGTTPASMAMNRSASGWLRDSASNRAISPGLGGLSAASRAVRSYIGRAARSRARW
jgi:hypothetical protein